MRRDLKIGMLAGVILAGIAFIYICTRPALSTRSRMLKAIQEPLPEPAYVQPQPNPAQIVSIQPEPEQLPVEPPQPPFLLSQESTGVTQRYEVPERIKTSRFYIVRKGDTLSAISRKYYGSPNKWHKIYEVNYAVLSGNPNKLTPGTKLIIPD